MKNLREKHCSYYLTDFHLVLFKQNLINTLRNEGAKDKEIYIVAQRMDGFRPCITNKDSLKDIIDNYPGGEKKIFYIYYKFLLKEKALAPFILKFGK